MMLQQNSSLCSAYVRLPTESRRGYPMAMPQTHSDWTLEMVHALPNDGMRYELIDGELLVSPAPSTRHQRVLARLYTCCFPMYRPLVVTNCCGHRSL